MLRRRRRFAVFPLHWATQTQCILFSCSFHTQTSAQLLTLAQRDTFLFFCAAAPSSSWTFVCCRRFYSLAWIFPGAFGALRSWRLDLDEARVLYARSPFLPKNNKIDARVCRHKTNLYRNERPILELAWTWKRRTSKTTRKWIEKLCNTSYYEG